MQQQRMEEEDRKAKKRNEELVEMQNRAQAQREALRRKTEQEIQEERRRTDERRAALERENMKARALAEAEGRIREQRENEEIFARQIQLKGEERRKQIKDAIHTTFTEFGSGFTSFITDKDKVTRTLFGATALMAGVYSVREGARVAGKVIERRLMTPALVRETSRSAKHFTLRKRLARSMGYKEEGQDFTDVVLRDGVSDRVERLAVSTRNTRNNAAPYRHMLFYGPPGTGKTMVAKRLARSSEMDYAIMSGGDVGPLGREAVTELHKLFDWSQRSRRGLLLFIDEADAFLASRSRTQMSEDQRNALNALLYRTGEASKRFMMVLATNRPGDLDTALTDRVDEAMVFDLPDESAREKLVRQYFEKYIVNAGSEASRGPFGLMSRPSAKIIVEDIDDDYLKDLARRTEGFSGRAISKLMISVQGNVYGQTRPVLTQDLMEEVVQWKLREHEDKKHFGKLENVDAYNKL